VSTLPLPPLADLADEYEFLDSEDRYRLLIDLGRRLDPMPDALKTDATKVRGCSASVWLYPTRLDDGRLQFIADSNAGRPPRSPRSISRRNWPRSTWPANSAPTARRACPT